MNQRPDDNCFKSRLNRQLHKVKLPGGFQSNLLYSGKQVWLIPVYAAFYLPMFIYLEKTITPGDANFHVISCPLDKFIPFQEIFIIPYILWFVFMGLTIFYFAALDPTAKEYHQLCLNLGVGMTFFIVFSFLYPNGLQLRPSTYPRHNLLTTLVTILYSKDTSTNVFPSIHVYNTVCCLIAVYRTPSLKHFRWIQKGLVPILSILIILATMFLKQHSVWDVLGALTLNIAMWILIYKIPERKKSHQK